MREIDDSSMLQIMAEENLNWSTAPIVMTQTVLAAKEFIDAELMKYDSYDKCPNKSIKALFTGAKGDYKHCKKNGAGQTTILKFLGSNWKQWVIQKALEIINDDSLDKKAVEDIPTLEQASVFRKSVKKHEIPKLVQREIAKTIVEEGIGKRDIPAEVEKHSLVQVTRKPKGDFGVIEQLIAGIRTKANSLERDIKVLRSKLETLNVTQLKGIKPDLASYALGKLFNEVERLRKGLA